VDFIRRIRKRTRAARFERFKAFVRDLRAASANSDQVLHLLDLGGTVAFWEDWWKISDQEHLHITLVNNHDIDVTQKQRQSRSSHIDNVYRDATTLTLGELRNYDLIFANSFFEHLRTRKHQKALANTITESGVPYFVQVPNKCSPIDPHHPFAPFFALYPIKVRCRLLMISAFAPSNIAVKPKTLDDARRWQLDYNPLGLRDMKALFPTGTFEVERTLGIPMSILVWQTSRPAPALAA
jgi:hypothetical protein